MRIIKLFILNVILFVGVGYTNAKELHLVLDKMFNKFAKIDSVLSNGRSVVSLSHNDSVYELGDLSVEDGIQNWTNALKRTNSVRTGVDFTASYDHKFGDLTSDVFNEEFIGYSDRIQASLTWNILGSGFFRKSIFDQKAELLGEQRLLDFKKKQGELNIEQITDYQKDILNGLFNNVLQTKIEVCAIMIDIQSLLQKDSKSLMIDVVDLRYQMELLRSKRRTTKIIVDDFLDIDYYVSEQHKLDSLRIDSLLNRSSFFKMALVKRNLMSNEEHSISYWNDVKLSPFVRLQYYDRTYNHNQTQIDCNVGLSLSLPISTQSTMQKREVRERINIHDVNQQQIDKEVRLSIHMLINEIDNNLLTLHSVQDAIRYYQDKAFEAKRLYNARKQTVFDVFKEYDKLLDCQMLMCDLILKREILKTELSSILQ